MTISEMGLKSPRRDSPEQEPFLSYGTYLKKKYGGRVYRVAVDGGFSCPNRDSSKRGTGRYGSGCAYCDEYGARAAYLSDFRPSHGNQAGGNRPDDEREPGNSVTVREQVARALAFIKGRYKAENFILYFQAFSGTYARVDKLKLIYDEALALYPFKELSVSTRPDCIDEHVAELLASYKPRLSDVWVELGLQSMHDRTLDRINRGHGYRHFHEAFLMLKSRGIRCAVHVIFGLPGESQADMMATIDRLADLRPDGIKIHDLHIPAGTELHREFLWGELSLSCGARHLAYVKEALQRLPGECVIMRLTCDTPANRRIVPITVPGKESFLRTLRESMLAEDIWQGKYFERGRTRLW